MSTIQEAIRRLTIQATVPGVVESTDRLRQLGEAYKGVTVQAESSGKATQSMEKRLESIQRRYDVEYRAQKDLTKLQRDLDAARAQGLITLARQNELMALAGQSHDRHSQMMQIANGQATRFAGSLGPVGSLLMAIGPAGLVAAAGVGVLTLGLVKAREAAHTFADDMAKLRDIAEVAGLSTTQMQAVFDQGAKFGLPEERVGAALQRFTAQMDEFRRAQGELFELTRRIDPALAREMMQARSTAEAMDFLAQVYAKAGDARGKLDRLIGGRQGGTLGLLFAEIGKEGGIDAVTNAFKKSGDAIDTELIVKVAKLKREIDDMSQDARRNFESIFSEQVLSMERAFVAEWLELSRVMKDFSTSGDWKDLVAKLNDSGFVQSLSLIPGVAGIAAGVRVVAGLANGPGDGTLKERADQLSGQIANAEAIEKIRDLSERESESLARLRRELDETLMKIQEFGAGAKTVAADAVAAASATPSLGPAVGWQGPQNNGPSEISLEARIKLQREHVSALGSAATAADRLRSRELALNVAVKDGILTQQEANRALGIDKAQESITLQGRRLGLLGDLAAADEVALQKQREINLATAQGVKISEAEAEAIITRTRLQYEYSQLSSRIQFERDQLGRSDVDATIASRLRSEGLPIDLNSAVAAQMRWNEELRTARDLWVGFGTGIAQDLRAGLEPMEALTNALNRFADKLLDMAMSKLMQQAFGGILGAFSFSGPGSSVGDPTVIGGLYHQGGIVGAPSATRIVHPAYFDDAPRYHNGGMIGPGEMPIIAQAGEEVITRADPRHRWWNGGGAMSQSAPIINLNVVNYGNDKVEVGNQKQETDGSTSLDVIVGKMVAKDMNKAGSATNNALRNYGLEHPRTRRG